MAAPRKTLLARVRALFWPEAGSPPRPIVRRHPFALVDEEAPVGTDPSPHDRTPPRPTAQHVVDNRAFVLGLDHLYREAMRRHERDELLQCARLVARQLSVRPATVPVEGYYTENEQLTEYFLLMRALQAVDGSRAQAVKAMPEFRRLEEVASSPIYGKPAPSDSLLPAACDPLSQAMRDLAVDRWSAQSLTDAAHANAVQTDDISLVGLAARTRDPVVLAGTRESVVLYAEMALGSIGPRHSEYVWAVDEELARQASRFVATFNSLFDEQLPPPDPAHAMRFWQAHRDNDIVGRCVRLGLDDSVTPVQHYHWAIYHDRGTQSLAVQEFWRREIWTTARYRERGCASDGSRML